MVEKTNIPIVNKDTKKVGYFLNLDTGYWLKSEYNSEGFRLFDRETSYGITVDDRKNKL